MTLESLDPDVKLSSQITHTGHLDLIVVTHSHTHTQTYVHTQNQLMHVCVILG